jgi:carbonic anhydrase
MPEELFLRGLRHFRQEYFPKYKEQYRRLVDEGQHPTTLFIGCADSRVVPHLLTGSAPGEFFILRNVGNIVPPFDPSQGYHGTAAGIEFAVLSLSVKNTVVCGHSHCGAIRALYEPLEQGTVHLEKWLDLARAAVLPTTVSPEALARTEQRSVILQLEHLLTYPMVRERVEQGALYLHGWHYVIEDGVVQVLDPQSAVLNPWKMCRRVLRQYARRRRTGSGSTTERKAVRAALPAQMCSRARAAFRGK